MSFSSKGAVCIARDARIVVLIIQKTGNISQLKNWLPLLMKIAGIKKLLFLGVNRWSNSLLYSFLLKLSMIVALISVFILAGTLRKFLRFFIIGAVIKAFDIIALDWFLLTKTHFFQHYFPETEGCAGWKDFGYNRRQQARQCVMIVIGSAITAWVFVLL